MLKGKRVTLRHMAEADLPVFTAYRSNPGAHGMFDQTESVSPAAVRKKFEETGYSTPGSETFMVCDENGSVIGHVSHFKERAYSTARELGWVIYDEATRGKGYATESVSLLIDYIFNSFPINRVECVTSPRNSPSVKLAEKVGLKYEGTLRELVFVRGTYDDGAVYSMLRSDLQMLQQQGSASMRTSSLEPNHCVLYNEPLQAGHQDWSDSVAHVIPSALGGRLKPTGICSAKANLYLNDVVDEPLILMFGRAPAMMGISRDRATPKEAILEDANGKKWSHPLDGQGPLTPARQTVTTTDLGDGVKHLEFTGTEQQFRGVAKSFPKGGETPDELLAKATKLKQKAPELFLGLGPIDAQRLALAGWTMIALFAAARLQIRSDTWATFVLDEPTRKKGSPTSNVGFTDAGRRLDDSLGPLAHRIALWNVPERNLLMGQVELFGGFRVLINLANNWTKSVSETYGVDPMTGNQGTPSFKSECDIQPAFKLFMDSTVQAAYIADIERMAAAVTDAGHGATRVFGNALQ